MLMTVTLTDVTTDKAVRFLSALEVSGLLTDTRIQVNPGDQEPSQIETAQEPMLGASTPPLRLVDKPYDAADCDLFIADFMGFHLQDALDAWVARDVSNTNLYKLSTPLPLIGSTRKANLLPLATVSDLLDWNPIKLRFNVDRGNIESVVRRKAPLTGRRHHQLTREQVAIIKLAETINVARGRKHMTHTALLMATTAFLTAFPSYRQALVSAS